MKFIINPFATGMGWVGIGLFTLGLYLMYLSDGIKK